MIDVAPATRTQARASRANAAGQPASAGYVLERQVGHLLRRAHQRHAALFQAMLAEALGEEAALTPTQWAALVTLATHGEATQNALGRLVAMDPATTQGVVRRLVARGLVARSTDAADRRTVRLSVTEAGRATVAAALPTAAAISEATLAPLSPEERLTFLHLLQRMAFA
jgi:DNA-binding MarR family transcriptional regulator